MQRQKFQENYTQLLMAWPLACYVTHTLRVDAWHILMHISAPSTNNVPLMPRWRPTARTLLIITIYLVCWYGLDRAAQALEVGVDVSIWNPPAALDVALLLVFGPVFTPLLALGTVIDHWFVTTQPVPLPVVLLMSIIRMAVYGGTSMVLLRVLRIDPRLRQLRDVVWFVVLASLIGPLVVALLQEGTLVLYDVEAAQGWFDRMLLAWAGIATGVVVFAPVLLIVLRRLPRVWLTATPAPLPAPIQWPSRRSVLQAAVATLGLLLGIYLAYGAPRGTDLDYTYVVMLPLVWVAIRYELFGAVWAVLLINLGAATLVAGRVEQEQAFALQFGLMIVSQGGLVLGALMLQRRQMVEERLRLERALAETQKMESIGRLTRSVAHDFNNMLQAIRGHIQIAMFDVADAAVITSLRDADLAVQRAADLVRQLLHSASEGPGAMEPVDLNALAQETATLVRRSLPNNVAVELQLDPQLPLVVADATQLRQVVLNLVVNAGEALHGSPGTITITTSTAIGSDARALANEQRRLVGDQVVCLTVADTGWGIAPETQARMFEPFFSTKADGHGLGLGIVQGIVHGHDGALDVDSVVGAGTTFRVWLPITASLNT